jgi:hypothetical protein
MLSGAIMKYVAGGLGVVALALAAWASVLSSRLNARTDERDLAVAQYQTEVAKHAVSLTSIGELNRIIDAKNAESDKRASEYVAQEVADREAVKASDARYRANEIKRAYLDGVVKSRVGKTDCPVSAGVVKALEGL